MCLFTSLSIVSICSMPGGVKLLCAATMGSLALLLSGCPLMGSTSGKLGRRRTVKVGCPSCGSLPSTPCEIAGPLSPLLQLFSLPLDSGNHSSMPPLPGPWTDSTLDPKALACPYGCPLLVVGTCLCSSGPSTLQGKWPLAGSELMFLVLLMVELRKSSSRNHRQEHFLYSGDKRKTWYSFHIGNHSQNPTRESPN